jgi:hypothetical protein
VAFPYNDDLSDARSRLRYAVGDIVAPGLFPDATYDAQWALSARARATFAAQALDDAFSVVDLTYADGDAVVLITLYDTIGLDAGEISYVISADSDTATFQLAATPGGSALAITADGAGVIGLVDEAAAIREVARGLAARYATKPTNVRLTSGLSVAWSERVAQWNRIANGDAGGALASGGKGFRLRRGPAVDYTTGDGDA